MHDELVFEVPEDRVGKITERVVDLMSGAADLSVTLKVDTGTGANWDEAH